MSALQIVAIILGVGITIVGWGLLARAVKHFVTVFKLGASTPAKERTGQPGARTATLLREFLGHTRMSRLPIVAIAHWVTMISFGVLFLTLVQAIFQLFDPHFVLPLIAASEEEVKAGRNPIFQSHMWDGSAVPLEENLEIARELLAKSKAAKIILEIEIGVVGGEEDGVEAEINEKLYTSPEDFEKTIDALGAGENGKYLLAATFGNVHGVYKPGNVKLTPSILLDIQKAVGAEYGKDMPFDLVMHGGSGSTLEEIRDLLGRTSITPVPQSLDYLVEDVARRHGRLRVGIGHPPTPVGRSSGQCLAYPALY